MHSILLLSDIHANLAALETVWHDASNIAPIDETWVLGDSVGYGPQPNEVVAYIRHLPRLTMVKGNHEAAALGEISISPSSTRSFNPVAAEAVLWTSRRLSTETRQFLGALPLIAEERDVTLCHGSPREPLWEYLLSVEIAKANLKHFPTSGCAVGHSHVPFVIGFDGEDPALVRSVTDGYVIDLAFTRWFINPGSVGQPRDGDHRASYAVVQFGVQGVETPFVSFHRVEYDFHATQKMIDDFGLPSYLGHRLAEGR